jgi:hypothetical protein
LSPYSFSWALYEFIKISLSITYALFVSLEGRGGNGFEKKEETSGKNKEV